MEKSRLLLPTHDARLMKLKIRPKCRRTKISYKLKMYDESTQRPVKRKMCFEGVVAIAFQMNYFDEPIGSEACGFYEIFSREKKVELLERNFLGRREEFLFHGDYDYDSEEPYDILNNRESIDEILEKLDRYRLFQQQTTGGTYSILAKRWIAE